MKQKIYKSPISPLQRLMFTSNIFRERFWQIRNIYSKVNHAVLSVFLCNCRNITSLSYIKHFPPSNEMHKIHKTHADKILLQSSAFFRTWFCINILVCTNKGKKEVKKIKLDHVFLFSTFLLVVTEKLFTHEEKEQYLHFPYVNR